MAGMGAIDDDAAWREQAIAELKNISSWQQRWVVNDERQRWIQIAATVSIPLFGVIWKMIGKLLTRGE